MPVEIRMPQLGESVTEGTVVRWLKQPGDHVALDESLAEIETEKVNVEIPSPYEGTLTAHLVEEGATVDVGVPIAAMDAVGAGTERAPQPPIVGELETAAAATAQPVGARHASPEPAQRVPETAGSVASAVGAGNASRRAAGAPFEATGPLGPADRAHGMFSTGGDEAARTTGGAPPSTTPAKGVAHPSAGAGVNGAAAGEMAGRYSPAVLRLAREHGIDLGRLSGTGAGGRISRKDVQRFIDAGGAAAAAPEEAPRPRIMGELEREIVAPAPAVASPGAAAEPVVEEVQEAFATPAGRTAQAAAAVADGRVVAARATPEAQVGVKPASPAPTPAAPAALGRTPQPPMLGALGPDEELEPLTPTRRAIANHMVQSVRTAPHAWMMIEVDVTRLVQFRERVRDRFRDREGVELTYLPFMVKAVVAALKQFPRLNSSWSDDGVILKRRIHIGIAVNASQGLMVPVVHDADNLSVAGLAKTIQDLAERARARRLRLEDVQGGTFTVDNVGPIGSIVSQPIINQPQCAIVTMESIVKRPVVVDDAIALRSMMNCCISFDHRIVDGGDVGPFMKALKQNLEAMGSDTPLY